MRSKELVVKRFWSTTGVVALTGALLLTSAPTASADYVRDKQWVIDVINFKKVWAESQGEGVTVAVVDTGVDGSHPDLTGQVLKGMDVTGSGDAQNDTNGHGTGMASLIAGHGHGTNNSEGVIGLAPKAKILPIKASSTGDDYRDDQWAEGVRYAVDQGADVINLSFGGSSTSPDPEATEAIKYALQHNVVVVSGTGNDGTAGLEYPAKLPGVVAVGAVDESLKVWKNSNFGPGVTLTAPGVNIARADTSEASGYAEGSGVSDATAYVSAAAALVRAKYPDLTAGQVINRLIKSATFLDHDVKKVPDEEYGYGIIRPYAALTRDIPKGPKQGPLAQSAPSTSTNSGTASDDDSTSQAKKKKKKSSSGSILLIAGIAAVVVVIGIAAVVIRSRRNGGNGGPGSGGGTPPAGTGYPPQPPTGYQPYPNTPPSQGYPAPPGQSPQHPNPYAQQPPHQGQ
ncbi:type VII secretion-associated serine protease mycosin [Streptomyces curacoi]|uniref:Serine protease n=1 Tax=Streptomyces curacoi TaxID=146536 RepID=A0A117NUQ2_9ACTN|nr:type VII secretion-associated serine protease mycosin [Streptomyces curacoi]KUM67714.1 serine protease [Streptomyces curacoi]